MWEFRAEKADRLDRLLRAQRHTGAEWLSRQAWDQLLLEGFVQVDDRIQTKGGANVSAGALVRVRFPHAELGLLEAEKAARLVWMDPEREWGIFFKDPGLDTYPLMPWDKSAFANQVCRYVAQSGPVSAHAFAALADPPRLEGGLLQRLDRDTSGLVSVAFTSRAKSMFRQLFSEGKVEKGYLALVLGDASALTGKQLLSFYTPKGGKTRAQLGGPDPVELKLRVMQANAKASLVEISTCRGIRHIVRAAMACLGFPLVGDSVYGDGSLAPFHQLHAHYLRGGPFPGGLEAMPPQSFLDSRAALGLH